MRETDNGQCASDYMCRFILYAIFGHHLPGLLTHKEYTWRSIVDVVIFTSEGLFGQPLSTSSSYVASFVIFGAFLSATGAGQWFIDMAYSDGEI